MYYSVKTHTEALKHVRCAITQTRVFTVRDKQNESNTSVRHEFTTASFETITAEIAKMLSIVVTM